MEEHIEFAQRNAGVWIRRTPRRLIEPDEVRAVAYLALCEAAGGWSPERGVGFRQFAFFRIRAAIVDEIRARVGRAGRPAQHRLYTAQLASLDQLTDDHGFQRGDVDPALATVEDIAVVDAALARLPERERFVLTMRIYEDMQVAEIGELLGVSQGRISQLITQAGRRLQRAERVGLIARLS